MDASTLLQIYDHLTPLGLEELSLFLLGILMSHDIVGESNIMKDVAMKNVFIDDTNFKVPFQPQASFLFLFLFFFLLYHFKRNCGNDL